jgi:hypothetical protein
VGEKIIKIGFYLCVLFKKKMKKFISYNGLELTDGRYKQLVGAPVG